MPPQLVAAQAEALAAQLASSAASAQALAFYRIPLFLLPIYQAAAVQYGVPWQILAAINEIETDYGSDQSVSTAGAVGWMQFEPSTWTGYGVDALNAGYADPYNPVDAIFAAARYLRAAGAATDLRGAILAYNHSNEYADSVLLRAKLISTYPKSVIATLTGLVDDRLPVTGKQLAWSAPLADTLERDRKRGAGSACAPDRATGRRRRRAGHGGHAWARAKRGDPGSTAPPEPAAAAAAAAGTGKAARDRPAPAAGRAGERSERQGGGGAGRSHHEARQLPQAGQVRRSCATSTATCSPTPGLAASPRPMSSRGSAGAERRRRPPARVAMNRRPRSPPRQGPRCRSR